MAETRKEDAGIYPNPCKDIVHVGTMNQDVQFTIYNSVGNKIYQGSGGGEINVSSWSSGIYLVKIEKDSVFYLRKLIRE
jgi:hypothetical protein